MGAFVTPVSAAAYLRVPLSAPLSPSECMWEESPSGHDEDRREEQDLQA